MDSPLTRKGRDQARHQGQLLQQAGLEQRDVECFASPITRAWDTAQIALDHIGGAARADDRLVEIGFGAWEGLTHDEIDEKWPWSSEIENMIDWTFSAVGGETYEAMCDRVLSFLNDLRGPSVVVTHGITSRVLRGLWLGVGYDGINDLPGGQGNVHHLCDGAARELC